MALTLVAAIALLATPVTPMDALLQNVPGAGQVSDPRVLSLGTVRMTMRHTVSNSSEAALAEHFTQRFAKVGLSVSQAMKGTIAGMDASTNVAYSASLSNNGMATDVLISSFELTFESVAPLFPGASHVTGTHGSLSYRADASASAVEEFYSDTLKQAGWAEVRPMVFVKGDRQLFIDAIGFGEDTSVQVVSRTVEP